MIMGPEANKRAYLFHRPSGKSLHLCSISHPWHFALFYLIEVSPPAGTVLGRMPTVWGPFKAPQAGVAFHVPSGEGNTQGSEGTHKALQLGDTRKYQTGDLK